MSGTEYTIQPINELDETLREEDVPSSPFRKALEREVGAVINVPGETNEVDVWNAAVDRLVADGSNSKS